MTDLTKLTNEEFIEAFQKHNGAQMASLQTMGKLEGSKLWWDELRSRLEANRDSLKPVLRFKHSPVAHQDWWHVVNENGAYIMGIERTLSHKDAIGLAESLGLTAEFEE